VFATSATFGGDLGGLTGADAICQSAAESAKLPGTFVAWLSTSTVDAASRLVLPGTTTRARGWVRTDGKPVSDTVFDLLSGAMYYPIALDESGADLRAMNHVNTGTVAGGALDPSATQCSDWTAADAAQMYTRGDLGRTTQNWTNIGTINCATGLGHLYCFQVDYDTPLAVTPADGRIAFLSAGKLDPSKGIATADALCASEAQAQALPGTFLAMLSTQAQAAAARFDGAQATWVRTDGIALAASAAAVLAAQLDTPLNVDAAGAYHSGQVWCGSSSPGTPAAAADDCGDWTSGAPGQQGLTGASSSSAAAFGATTNTCSTPLEVYCLQK